MASLLQETYEIKLDEQLKEKIQKLKLPIPPHILGKLTIPEKRDLLKKFGRYDSSKNKTEQIWSMADIHAGLFTDLNYESYDDFIKKITQMWTLPNRQRNSDIAYVGYRILQTHFITKIEEIETKKKLKSEYVESSYFQERLAYFKSNKFIENLSSTLPERTDLENQTANETGYQEFLSNLFQTKNIKYRTVMESDPHGTAIQANRQCQVVLGTTARTITLPQNPTNCYICGLPIRPIDKERGFKTAECEHLLPVMTAITHFWICKSPSLSAENIELLKNEYKWSHMCCNRVKSNLSLVEFFHLNPIMNGYYFSQRRARQLLNEIFRIAYDAATEMEQKNKQGDYTQGKGVKWSDCLQVYHGLKKQIPDVFTSNQAKTKWIDDRVSSLSNDFSKITEILNNTRVAQDVIANVSAFGVDGLRKLGMDELDTNNLKAGLRDLYSRYKIIAAISRDFLDDALYYSEAGIQKVEVVKLPPSVTSIAERIVEHDVDAKISRNKMIHERRFPNKILPTSTSGRGILKKNIINNKKLIKKELQKSNSKLKKLLDIGNRLKLGLDYRNKKYDTKNNNSLFNFKLNYMRKSLGNEILDSIKNITNKKSLDNWIDEMFLKIKNLPKDTKEFETSVKKNHKQLSQVDDKVKIFNIKDKKDIAKGIKKKKYIAVNIKLYPQLKTVPKLAFIPISLVSSKILTSLNKLNIENYKLIELKTSVSNDLSYFLIEFNLDIDKKYDKNLIKSQIKNLFNSKSFLLDINENSISSFPIFDKVKVSISNLNNKTKNKHSMSKGMRSKGMRSKGMRSKGMRIRKTNKNKKIKKTKKKRKN